MPRHVLRRALRPDLRSRYVRAYVQRRRVPADVRTWNYVYPNVQRRRLQPGVYGLHQDVQRTRVHLKSSSRGVRVRSRTGMRLDSLGSSLAAAGNAPVSTDPVDQMQAVAHVRVLKKALEAQSDAVMTLISSLTGVGKNLDVRG